MKNLQVFLVVATVIIGFSGAAQAKDIVHDAEYYILEAQHGEKWAAEDNELDKKLAEFRAKNDGRPPNIFYILIDDIGFGDLGIPELNSVRGYETPSINKIADEGMRFTRMYTEPSCTPTRVAFMTGRQPYRNGMGNTAVDISGFGLAGTWATSRKPGPLIRALTTPLSRSTSRVS
ncbi:MAG: sulfatase-like hydrolase/transferase [Planctomycetota bacterium]|jgi:arylsulfatase